MKDFIHVHGKQFILRGKPFKFIGVNIRGLVYYEHSQAITPMTDQQLELVTAYALGAKVVRLFLPHKAVSPEKTIENFGQLIAEVKKDFPTLYFLPVLTNFYSDGNANAFHVPGDDKFYEISANFNVPVLNKAFFTNGYQENYLPFVQKVVTAFKDEPQIFAWDIGNELKVDNDPETFVNFNLTIADEIRNHDPNHLISTGMVSTHQACMAGKLDLQERLYGSNNLDFITMHVYNGNRIPSNDAVEDDIGLAHKLNMPFIIEEASFDPNHFPGDRSPYVRAGMEYWFGLGASGYMEWGFIVDADNDDDDNDWDQLFRVYRDYADRLG